jgi:hypothetical protein
VLSAQQINFTSTECLERAGEEDVCYFQDDMVKVKLTSSVFEVHVVPFNLPPFP